MPRWYWICLIVFMAGGVLATFDALVIMTSILTLGLGVFVWVFLSNAWWMVLLTTPFAWFQHRGRPWVGLLFSVALIPAPATWYGLRIAHDSARLLPQAVDPGAGQVAAKGPIGLRLIDVSCEASCLGFLASGSVAWVYDDLAGLGWRWAPEADCRAFDPARAPGPCLLAMAAPPGPAEITVTHSFEAAPHQKEPPVADWVRLNWVSRLELVDGKGLRLQDQEVAYSQWLPLLSPDGDWPSPATQRILFRTIPIQRKDGQADLDALLMRAGLTRGETPPADAALLISLRMVDEGRDHRLEVPRSIWAWVSEGQRRLPDLPPVSSLMRSAVR